MVSGTSIARVHRMNAESTTFGDAVRSQRLEPPVLRPTRRGGVILFFEPYRRRLEEFRRHAEDDAEWTRLRRLVEEAATWRDPESLAAVEACIARLKETIRGEWEPE